jgi:biopolymer transport protein ExbB/TolQ
MLESFAVKDTIHWLSSTLETPAIVVLIAMVVITLVELGSVVVEIVLERRHARVNVTRLLENMQGKSRDDISELIKNSSFLRRKKIAFKELLSVTLRRDTTEAHAAKLISAEELRCQRVVQVTDIISRIAPMFGLMATLIPLGPGLIALGQGDTQTLSQSLLTAFDATVAGLASAGVAYVISRVRKRWYEGDLTSMEAVTEGILAELFPNEAAPAANKTATAPSMVQTPIPAVAQTPVSAKIPAWAQTSAPAQTQAATPATAPAQTQATESAPDEPSPLTMSRDWGNSQ